MKDHLQRHARAERRDDWITPPSLFGPLDVEFGFDLDVCATAASARCPRYFTPADDGLAQRWEGVCWMNPPFDAVGTWVAKAALEASRGVTVVALLPARTDTGWWHRYCVGREIRFIRGRVSFLDAAGATRHRRGHNAPFPCLIVVFRPTDAVAPPSHLAHQPALRFDDEEVA